MAPELMSPQGLLAPPPQEQGANPTHRKRCCDRSGDTGGVGVGSTPSQSTCVAEAQKHQISELQVPGRVTPEGIAEGSLCSRLC